MKNFAIVLVLFSLGATLIGCGGSNGGGGGTPTVQISSAGNRIIVDSSGTATLTANATGLGPSPTFAWSLSASAQAAVAMSSRRTGRLAAAALPACSSSALGTLNPTNAATTTYTPPPAANIPSGGCGVTAAVAVTGKGTTVNATFGISVTGPISVAISNPISSIPAASSAVTLNATVTNDENSAGVQWQLAGTSCASSGNPCGTLSNQTTSAVTYTPPQNPPSPSAQVIVTAVSKASAQFDSSTNPASAQDPFTVTPAPITLVFSPNPPFTAVNAGGSAQTITVNLQHDIGGQGVGFTLSPSSCNTSAFPCGTLTSPGPQPGTPPNTVQTATYTPPSSQTATSATITATAVGGSQPSISFTFTINPPAPPPLVISTTTLPNGTENTSYSQTLSATGGVTPYSWALASGTLPTGLSLSATGVISGTPTAAGNFSFTVKVSDAESPPQTATQPLGITINSVTTGLNITTTSPLPGATQNSAYSTTVTASGGTPPYTWSLGTGSALPAGLSLTSGSPSATISGKPTTTGTFQFTLDVKDSASSPATASASFLVTVAGSSAFNCPTTFNPLGSLCGTNLVEIEGSRNSGTAMVQVAVFLADNAGNVISGEEFGNDTVNGPTTGTITGGSYVMDSNNDGRGVLTLIDSTAAVATFHFVNHTATNYKPGPLEQFDSSGTLAGGLIATVPTNAAVPQIPANTVVGVQLVGMNGAGQRVGLLGNFQVGSNGCDGSPGSFNSQTGETIVTNSGGTVTTGLTAIGSCTPATNGVGTAQITLSGGTPFTNNTLNFKYFEFTSGTVLDLALFVGTDSVGANQPVLAGPVLQNPSPGQVTNSLFASYCGGTLACVATENGTTTTGGPINALVRFVATAGSGNTGTISGVLDENAAGAITSNATWPYNAYTVDSNGAGTLTGTGQKTIHFVYTAQGLYTLDESAQVRTGNFDQQNSVTIESLGSPYLFGGSSGVGSNSTLFEGFITPTGTTTSGTFPGTVDVITSAGLFPNVTTSGTYSAMSTTTGRGTGTAKFTNGATVNTVIYVARHRRFFVLDVQSTTPFLIDASLQ